MSILQYIITFLIIAITLVLAIVFDSALIIFIGFLMLLIALIGRVIIKRKKGEKGSALQTTCYVTSIASILFASFWYLSIPLAIIGLVNSISLIKETGKKAPKATMIISIIGIITCIYTYLSVITLIMWEY